MTLALQSADTAMLLQEGSELLGLAIAVATVSGLVALLYRWYVREHVPNGLAVLFGLTVVALYLGTTTALGQVIGGQEDVLELRAVLPNLAAFAVGGVASYVGLGVGDRLGTDLFVTTGGRDIDADVSEIVQTVGRVTSVKLPEEIDDIVGYDPMPEAIKDDLANRRFLFPRRLTRDELRSRLVSRLKTDYGVGHVDLDLADDGSVTYLAVGSRAAGIGPTLPPSTNAVAIRADPANAASAGDLVQVWETDPPQRVLTGELRGIAGETVTVAIDAAETPKLDQRERYRLVTLPVEDRPDREFASLLRAADETMGTVTVGPGSTLDGATVGSVEATVVAITREDAAPTTIPASAASLSAGDVLYLIAKPTELRRIESAAAGTSDGADGASEPDTAAASQTDPDAPGGVPTGDPGESSDGETPTDDAAETGSGGAPQTGSATVAQTTAGAGDDAPSEEPTDDTGEAEPAAGDDGRGPAEHADGPETGSTEASGSADGSDDDTAPEPTDNGDPAGEDTTDVLDGEASDDDFEAQADGDDVFGSLAGDESEAEVDVDDFLTSSDDVEVWDPDDRLVDDEQDADSADDGADRDEADDR
ncbi:potassium transporter TrkA [Halomicroarcula sp. GCM10025324]|uniref:potassium transporter TrkA n=1 Tax=Haloarcula TaxID=2237 RepID=UPI0023E7A8BA|nr:potassium transporter TrkA [Halomicroarcula sp. ZS-22-S1]